MAEVSPAEAVTLPLRKSLGVARMFSNFQRANGVAPVKPAIADFAQAETSGGCISGTVNVVGPNSKKRFGANAGTQVVMAAGNAACTKARPTSAGFMTLKP